MWVLLQVQCGCHVINIESIWTMFYNYQIIVTQKYKMRFCILLERENSKKQDKDKKYKLRSQE